MEFEPARDGGVVERVAAAFGQALSPGQHAGLCGYVALVSSWNRKLDLTAARGAEALCEVLLSDAFVLSEPALTATGARLIDVGTGAGAPLLPLLLLRADLSALCVEPQAKRTAFLRNAAARLALLQRVQVLQRRLDPARPGAGPLPGAPFDLACSRATFLPERWLPLALALAPRALVLTASAPPPPPPEGVQLLLRRDYRLPFSGAPRCVTLYLR